MLLYFSVALIVVVQAAERGSYCTTPQGEKATCISILTCPGVLQLLLNDEELDFVRQSQCGYDKVPLVCCGFQHYHPDVFEVFTKVPNEIHDFSELPQDMQNCGKVPANSKTQFPWLVSLEFDNSVNHDHEVKCVGSLVSSLFVLTAASCLHDKKFRVSSVQVGDVSSQDVNCLECKERDQRIPVSYVVIHSYYNTKNGNNDIAVVKLERPVVFNDNIQPICLPVHGLSYQSSLVTQDSDSNHVKWHDIIGIKDCRYFHPNRLITVNQICTNNSNSQTAIGEPLMRSISNRWYQEGVSSWNSNRPGEAAVYTRVSRYVRWVINIVRTEEDVYGQQKKKEIKRLSWIARK